ncbi:hypothetical protein L0F81_33755 [Streptomyces tricolor]|uniref:Uncharacterized protein n=1 Tax=Streptomyces tricolor TaxID=68277 RepID=A0ABS9JRR0_9ACTN|nr:hypothetical protein [Streptomyces tricolor]MCG0068174.1 hypothetical protein [Streptomyces tricolor]
MPTATTPSPVTEPDPSALVCPGEHVGPCATCQRKTHKYGRGGLPLCGWCFGRARERWGTGVRFAGTRD